jgi:class 3 adenylate cyclase
LSADGVGGPRAAARAAERLLDRDAASKEVSLAGLQVWQALTERVSGRPANPEVTLVFTDLVGFSEWSLRAGDDATLTLLRRVAQVTEPPLLAAGGHIVKRMGDGTMAVFPDAATAVGAVLAALEAVKTVEVGGYTPRMRAGVHTGRPQRIGSDWLGVDVNITARVMDRATRGGLVVSQTTLDSIAHDDFEALGVTTKRVRKQLFSSKIAGVPDDLAMYFVKIRRELPGAAPQDGDDPEA